MMWLKSYCQSVFPRRRSLPGRGHAEPTESLPLPPYIKNIILGGGGVCFFLNTRNVTQSLIQIWKIWQAKVKNENHPISHLPERVTVSITFILFKH